ncbi:MAG: hypothetical protein ACF8Q5_10245 [Phycisphaerales bacterium JB040]
MSGVTHGETSALTTGRKRHTLRNLTVALVLLLGALGAGVYFAGPSIASNIARGALTTTLADGTTLEPESVALSWSGPQTVTGLKVTSPDAHTATVDASLDRPLLALALTRGRGDLGVITVSGSATLNADAFTPDPDGDRPTDLPPADDAPGLRQIDLTEAFAARLDLQRLDLTITSSGRPDARGTATGRVVAEAGQPTLVEADLVLEPERPGDPTPTARLNVELLGLIPPSGVVGSNEITTDGSLTFDRLPSALVGALAPGLRESVDLPVALGPAASGDLTVRGRVGHDTSATLGARLSSETTSLTLNATLDAGRLTPSGDNTLAIETGPLRRGAPALARWLEDQSLDLTTAPELEIVVHDFDWPLSLDPEQTGPMNLHTATAGLTLRLSGLAATLPNPFPGEGRPPTSSIELQPVTLTASLNGDRLHVQTSLDATIDQRGAGILDVDVTATRFLTGEGAYAPTRVPALEGSLTATDLPTTLLQPLAGPDAPRLADLLGPAITASLVAVAPGEGDENRATRLAIDTRSDNHRLQTSLDLQGPLITVDPSVGLRLDVNRLSPLVETLLPAGDGPAPLTIEEDGAVSVTLTTLTVDLDAMSAGRALAGIRSAGDFTIDPVTLRSPDHPDPIRVSVIQGDVSLQDARLTTQTRLTTVALADLEHALRRATVDTVTTFADADGARPARTEITLDAQTVRTLALARWLDPTLQVDTVSQADPDSYPGGVTPALALARLDDRPTLKARPVLEGGTLAAPFTVTGRDYAITGDLSRSEGGVLTARATLDMRDTELIDLMTRRAPGLAGELLGPTAVLSASTTPVVNDEERFDEVNVTLTADRLSTDPLVFYVGEESVRLARPAQFTATLTPRALDLLQITTDQTADELDADPTALRLARPATVIATLNTLVLPGAGSPSLDATLNLAPLALAREAGVTTYDEADIAVRTTDDPGVTRLTASVTSSDRTPLTADLLARHLLDDPDAPPAFTGEVTLAGADPAVLDFFLGSTLATNMLGDTADASVTLADFPADGGTVEATLTSPRTTASLRAVAARGEVSLTQPAVITLTEITQPFSYQFTPFLPVVGAVTKTPGTHRPASVTVSALSLPLDFDLARASFRASIDPGSAVLQAERALQLALKEDLTIGDSFNAFTATLSEGTLSVTDLAIPLGEFIVPARGSYDLINNTENVFVQIPAAELLAEGIGGDQAAVSSLLNRFLNIGLRKRGALNADNPWTIDTDASGGTPQERRDRLRDGLNDILDRIGGE